MSRLNTAVTDVTGAIKDYRFSDAGQQIYSLLWDDFADWYLEASKSSPNHDLLVHALETILTLVHPIAPFVSEAIWGELPGRSSQLITTAWPVVDTTRTKTVLSVDQIREFDEVVAIVREIRTTRAELGLDKVTAVYASGDMWSLNGDLIARLARNLTIESRNESNGLLIHSSSTKAWLEADQKAIAQTIHRLHKQLDEKRAHLASLEAKLSNAKYVQSAPAKLVGETRTLHAETVASITKLDDQLAKLG